MPSPSAEGHLGDRERATAVHKAIAVRRMTHHRTLVTGAALVLIAIGWMGVGVMTVTRWHAPDIALFAAASVLAVVLAGVSVINLVRLVLRIRAFDLVPADSDFWQQYGISLWLPPLIFLAAVLLGTRL